MKRIAADPRQTGNHLFRSFPSGEGNISLELRQLSTSTASSRQPSPDWADPLTLPLYTISGLLPTTCYQNRLQTSSCKLLTLLRSLLLHTRFCKLTNALQCSIFKKTSLVLPPQSCGVFFPSFCPSADYFSSSCHWRFKIHEAFLHWLLSTACCAVAGRLCCLIAYRVQFRWNKSRRPSAEWISTVELFPFRLGPSFYLCLVDGFIQSLCFFVLSICTLKIRPWTFNILVLTSKIKHFLISSLLLSFIPVNCATCRPCVWLLVGRRGPCCHNRRKYLR